MRNWLSRLFKRRKPQPRSKRQEVFNLAKTYEGTWEWKGSDHNPVVVGFFADVGHSWVQDDETAWCAAFVGSVLEKCGIRSTRKLNARSYLDFGTPINLEDAREGDIVIFSRGDPNGWQGHVAFYVSHGTQYINVLGGNQSNQVNIKPYSRSRLLDVRRYE